MEVVKLPYKRNKVKGIAAIVTAGFALAAAGTASGGGEQTILYAGVFCDAHGGAVLCSKVRGGGYAVLMNWGRVVVTHRGRTVKVLRNRRRPAASLEGLPPRWRSIRHILYRGVYCQPVSDSDMVFCGTVGGGFNFGMSRGFFNLNNIHARAVISGKNR
jgi:hypothetical protein